MLTVSRDVAALLARKALMALGHAMLARLADPAGAPPGAAPATVSQECAWQLLFDLACAADLLSLPLAPLPSLPAGPLLARTAPGDDGALALDTVRGLIDPFDLHVRLPVFEQTRARCVQRSALLLGCFMAPRATAAAGGPDAPSVLAALAPVAGRFALLPFTQRAAAPAAPQVNHTSTYALMQ